jgi:NAD(P)-dependent dehydrogenase (short-subunit alcohol dehydrogenase family)
MAPPASFTGKTAIVTGASGGIGFAIARTLAERGAHIVMADRSPAKAEQLAPILKETGPGGVWVATCDVSKEEDVEAACQGAVDRFGRLDLVVNNAGLMVFKPLAETTHDDWMKVLGVDLLGAFYFIREGFKRMGPGGNVVNIASVHAVMTSPLVATYAASKAALLSLTRSAAIEGKEKGLRCNAILPGAVDTPMLWDNPNLKSGAEKLDPQDVGRPEDIAAAVAFLGSEEAAFVTGACLNVDGGRLAKL